MFKMHSGFDLLHYVLFFAKMLVKNTNLCGKSKVIKSKVQSPKSILEF